MSMRMLIEELVDGSEMTESVNINWVRDTVEKLQAVHPEAVMYLARMLSAMAKFAPSSKAISSSDYHPMYKALYKILVEGAALSQINAK
jgi:hypothetical protein